MNVSLKSPQWEVFSCDRRFRLLVAGRRFGKTYLALVELCQAAWAPGRLVWYIAPTYKQAKRIAWKPLKQLTRSYWASKPNETDLSVELVAGGTIALRGADNYDSLRGDGLDFLVMDECASMSPDVWSEVLRPSLSDRQGRALFIGTPRGFNHFYDLFQNASNQQDWAAFQFTTEEGGNVSREELESAAGELVERTYRQEFQASFENLAHGLVYYAFDRKENVQPVPYLRQYAICWALDFNVNPMCSVIAQIEDRSTRVDRLNGFRSVRVNVIDEIVLAIPVVWWTCSFMGMRQVVHAALPENPIIRSFGSSSGRRRDSE